MSRKASNSVNLHSTSVRRAGQARGCLAEIVAQGATAPVCACLRGNAALWQQPGMPAVQAGKVQLDYAAVCVSCGPDRCGMCAAGGTPHII